MFGFGEPQDTEIDKGTKAVVEGTYDRSAATEFQGYLTKQSMWLKVRKMQRKHAEKHTL